MIELNTTFLASILNTNFEVICWIWPWPLTYWPPKSIEVFLRSYICEVSLLYDNRKWSCGAETVKKSKVQIWPLTFWPKINRGQHICEVSSLYVKLKRSYCTETIFSRTDSLVKPVYLHNFVAGGIQTYFQCREIVENDPLDVKISWGE